MGPGDPAITISTPQTRKAPTAAGNPPSGSAEDASNAPPGVDQAILIGSRRHRLNKTPQSPIAMASAISPDAAWDGEAPMAVRPFSTTAKDEANPTKAARIPAKILCRVTQRCAMDTGSPTGSAVRKPSWSSSSIRQVNSPPNTAPVSMAMRLCRITGAFTGE